MLKAGAKIAALHRVIKKPADTVAVILIILGGVDAALGRNAVRAARTVLKTKRADLVAQFRQGSGGGRAGQTGAHHDDLMFAFIGGVDELEIKTVLVPLLRQRPRGDLAVEFH